MTEEKKIVYRVLVRRPKRRWENNIKMDIREIGWVGMDWLDLAQDRDRCWALVNTVNEPSGSIKFWEILE
jgi:hypothetical protein